MASKSFLDHVLSVYSAAREARKPHEAVWDRCLRAYRGEYDFSKRQRWQSKCVLPKIARDVDFISQTVAGAIGGFLFGDACADDHVGLRFEQARDEARGGGGGSSMARSISSCTSREAFLNSVIPLPKPRASSGSFFAPKSSNTTARMATISGQPRKARVYTFMFAVYSLFGPRQEGRLGGHHVASLLRRGPVSRQFTLALIPGQLKPVAPVSKGTKPRAARSAAHGGVSNRNSPRRFLRQAASLCPGSAGRSSP